MGEEQKTNYGKIKFDIESNKILGNLTLEKHHLRYLTFYVFKFRLFKQLSRGNNLIRTHVFGYLFTSPTDGTINNVTFIENAYPMLKDFKSPIFRDCMYISKTKDFEESPSVKNHEISNEETSFIPVEKVQEELMTWITQKLVVTKNYYVQSRKKYDSGFRSVNIIFRKKDVQELSFNNCIAVPVIDLIYRYSDSNRNYEKEVLGNSGEVIVNTINCYKEKSGKKCEILPNNICSKCGIPFCDDHKTKCEKCSILLCEKCLILKGRLVKHLLCSECV